MKITVCDELVGISVKELLSKMGFSRGMITHLKGLDFGITVNGEHVTVRRILEKGDLLCLDISDHAEDENASLVPTEMPLDIIYEDEDIIAINKPCGMATHPSIGHFTDTLANGLAYYFSARKVPFVFRALNRLDRDTSGVVLVSKNRAAAAKLSCLMQSGGVRKTYIAVLNGRLSPAKGIVDAPIRRREATIILREVCDTASDGAKRAVTEYETLFCTETASIVRAEPITGRTHQLRVHFSHMGAPIAGDSLYGSAATDPTALDMLMSRHALHAASLKVELDGGVLTLEAPLPPDMAEVCRRIKGDFCDNNKG